MHFPLELLWVVSQLLRMCRGAQFIFKTTNLECITYPRFCDNATCLLKSINWNKAVAQMDVDLKIPLFNTSVHMEVFRKGYTNRYHPFLINVHFNFCDIFSKKNYVAYGMILRNVLRPFTNVNHSCPFTGHLMARNLYLDETNLPTFPLGFYLFSITFIENFPQQVSEPIGVVKFHVQAMERVEARKKSRI